MSAKPTISATEFQCLKYDVADHIALVTLNRPERRNTLQQRPKTARKPVGCWRWRRFRMG